MKKDFLRDLFKEDENVPFEKRERNEWVEKDPLTGGEQTVVTIGKSFMMIIPHQGIKMTPEGVERYEAITALHGERKWEGDSEIQFITNRKPKQDDQPTGNNEA